MSHFSEMRPKLFFLVFLAVSAKDLKTWICCHMYLILLWKWLLGWTHNWEEVNSSSWWKKVQMQGRNIAAVSAMEQPCCEVMVRPFTEHHSLPPYPGPLWQAKNVKVQEKERLHTLNCPDKTVIAYDSFCPINLEQKWKYTEMSPSTCT